MEQMTSDILVDLEKTDVRYSTFWQRFFASLIDGLILSPLSIIDSYFDNWNSVVIITTAFLVGVIYKPFLEMRYGATLGKKALGLRVVNENYEKAGPKHIILRNIFDISQRVVLLISSLGTLGAVRDNSLSSFGEDANSGFPIGAGALTILISLVIIIDSIFLIADPRRRALHDRIGKTYVIQN